MTEEQEQQERRKRNLIGMLADVYVEGLDISILSLEELEALEKLHKDCNIDYNKQNPLPLGMNPDVRYIENRRTYVNSRITDFYKSKNQKQVAK